MQLLDLLTSPWAIQEDKLLEIQEIYLTHLRGEKIDIAAVEARLGRSLSNEQKAYSVEAGGVGLLTARGVMAPRANLFMQISGGIATSMLTRQVQAMRDDPRVKSVLINADSPGGNVFGVPAAVDALRELAAEKPTVVVGEGLVASAMYWFASAANALFIEGSTDIVGSIGVIMRLGWEPKSSNSIELVRGKYKRSSENGVSPSPHAIAEAEQKLDYLYGVLVDAVAQNRGVTSEQVLERMADGRTFVGQQAVDAGLVDGFSTVDAMLEQLATNPTQFAQRRKAVFATAHVPAQDPTGSAGPGADPQPKPGAPVVPPGRSNPKGVTSMTTPEAKPALTREAFQAEHPQLFAELRAAFTAEGAAAELARVQAVRAQSLRGHEKLIEALAADGKTTGPEAAAAIVKAERDAIAAADEAHRKDAPNPAPNGGNGGDGKAKTKEEQAALARAYAAENKVDFVVAMKKLGFA